MPRPSSGARGAVHVVMPDLAVAIRPADDDPLGANDCVRRRCDGEGQQQRAQGGSQAFHQEISFIITSGELRFAAII